MIKHSLGLSTWRKIKSRVETLPKFIRRFRLVNRTFFSSNFRDEPYHLYCIGWVRSNRFASKTFERRPDFDGQSDPFAFDFKFVQFANQLQKKSNHFSGFSRFFATDFLRKIR